MSRPPELRHPGLAAAAFGLAALVAAASLGGLLLPSVYARETASWATQGIGQDWFDLVVLVPVLIACGVGLLRGSRIVLLLFGGALVFAVYTFVLYAMAVHFNALFLVYCATLGVAFYALLALVAVVERDDVRAWFDRRAPVGLLGGFLIATAVAFAGLWLAQVIPALVRGGSPPGLAENGLSTNPIHVLDLSIVLPGLAAGGVSLLRHRSRGYVLAPMMMFFAILMSLSIGALMIVMRARGEPWDPIVATVMGAVAVASLLILVRALRHLRPAGGAARARG